jgi:RNA polymerase sigma factor
MREMDYMAVDAASNQDKMNEFISQNELFILKCTKAVSNRFITKSDDEWSIALIAFSQAVQTYNINKGSFYHLAELMIRNRLIDYYRSQGKYSTEIAVDPIVFDTEPEENDEDISMHLAVAKQVSKVNGDDVKLEIESITAILQVYGISFMDLADCSPHSSKTKTSCAKAVNYILSNPIIIGDLRTTKMLPLKIIEKNAKVPRKILERHRKYIIAAVEILSGEYPKLSEYLWYIRKENDK